MINAVSGSRFEVRNTSAIGYTLTNTFPASQSGITSVEPLAISYYDDYGFLSNTGWSDNNAGYSPDAGLPTLQTIKKGPLPEQELKS